MLYIIFVFLAGFLVAAIAKKVRRIAAADRAPDQGKNAPPAASSRQTEPRFFPVQSLLFAAEKNFLVSLRQALPRVEILTKVRMADVIQARKRYSGDFLSISQKHFDFVVCDPGSFCPLAIVELDDSSHRTDHRQRKNDRTKNEVCAEARIPLFRVRCGFSHDLAEIRRFVAGKIPGIAA